MQRYRIFTNDRGKKKGVPLYSCLSQVMAADDAAAVQKINKAFGPPRFAPIKAIQWPPSKPEDQDWLIKHVHEGKD